MYVYFIQSGKKGAIKIGKANNVDKRMAELQVGNQYLLRVVAQIPCKSSKHAELTEKRLHRFFAKQKIRGEWFQGNINLNKINDIE